VSGKRREPDHGLVGRAARRLGAQAAALVAVVVLLLTSTAVLVVLRAQNHAATMLIEGAVARADDVGDPPAGVFLVIRDGSHHEATAGLPPGVADAAALDAAAAGRPVAAGERYVHGVEYRIVTVRRPDGVVVQGVLDLTANHAERDSLLIMMLAAGAAGLVFAAVVGAWLGRRALRPLSSALALQRRFVADAGHELRTPLTLLGTRAQLLRRQIRRRLAEGAERPRGSDEELLAASEGIVADTERLTEILEDLLLAADPLAERPREPVDLVAVCRDVIDASAATALARGITLAGPDGSEQADLVEVSGSEVALRRALTAVVDNAIRHAGSRVEVAVTSGRGQAVVDVSDDGRGVDPSLEGQLFDRFATATRPPVGGPRRYGLGLALTAEIVAAHSGHVEHRDHVDRGAGSLGTGTTIRLALPLNETPGTR
jgi:two-component system, OmpR family, sensor kinase